MLASASCIDTGSEGMMSAFTDAEISYLEGQRIGRLATVGRDGQPHERIICLYTYILNRLY
jgi:hypothetical protein